MTSLAKFSNVPIIPSLEKILRQNTSHYLTDFRHDIEMIEWAARSNAPEMHPLLWYSRTSGTECHFESNVFIEGTENHYSWRYYNERSDDRILAYAVEISHSADKDAITGNIYQLDYSSHAGRVRQSSFPMGRYVTLYFSDGSHTDILREKYEKKQYQFQSPICFIKYHSDNQAAFLALMEDERQKRAKQ